MQCFHRIYVATRAMIMQQT